MSHAKRDQRCGSHRQARTADQQAAARQFGMYIALRLLRDGAHLTITTRFPKDAARRFTDLEDSGDWLHRLKIVGIDLRDPTQVISLADDVAAAGPLDILINNACQTVRRTPGAYAPLVEGESAPLPTDRTLPEMVTFDRISDAHPAAIAGALRDEAVAHHEGESDAAALAAHNAASLTALALKAGNASLDAHLAGTAIDAGGLLPDVQLNNSWTQTVGEVDPLELLEVQLCNSIAPFLLVSRLRPAMAAATRGVGSEPGVRRAYVVNVSAMEGQFSRRYQGAGHPHTNMAKAALNMLTRTSAKEMFETDRILMTAVDTGWITDERPHHEKLRIAAEGWHAPLDLVDGAARVYDPIVQGENGVDLYGCFREGLRTLPLVSQRKSPAESAHLPAESAEGDRLSGMTDLEKPEEFYARVLAATDAERRLPVALEEMPVTARSKPKVCGSSRSLRSPTRKRLVEARTRPSAGVRGRRARSARDRTRGATNAGCSTPGWKANCPSR